MNKYFLSVVFPVATIYSLSRRGGKLYPEINKFAYDLVINLKVSVTI